MPYDSFLKIALSNSWRYYVPQTTHLQHHKKIHVKQHKNGTILKKMFYFCTVVYATIYNRTIMIELQNEEVFSILTGKISSAINKTFLREFANEGIEITTEQWSVLACLWQKDKVTQQAICTLTSKDKPSMTRLIDKLEKANLVTRVSDHYDRRTNLIHLTETGLALQIKASEIVNMIAIRTLNNISEEELNTCRVVLKKIMSNLK